MIKPLLAFIALTLPAPTFGQTDSTTAHRSWVELAPQAATGDRTPFWLQANQWGTVPRQGNALSLRAGSTHRWALSENGRWQAGLGAEGVGIVTADGPELRLPEAYGRLSYGPWELSAGRRRQWVGLADSTLGTGSYVWSGNALPLPMVRFGLPEFTPVPFTRQWLAITGFYADGWFEPGRPVTSELKLHQKQLYGRLGRPGGRLHLYGGFNHQVQWGGRSPYFTVDGQMPRGFTNYLYAVTGIKPKGRVGGGFGFDDGNRVGNALGTIDFGVTYDTPGWNWFVYRQNIYEDGSLIRLTNIKDGLNGLRLRRKGATDASFTIREAVFELLYTKSQGEADVGVLNPGRDNYLNNAQVRDGWSYYGRGIGTPFIPPTSQTVWKFPPYGDSFTSNNAVWVLHSGLRGTLGERLRWQSKLSLSSNQGTYDLPFPDKIYQFSGLLALEAPVAWLGGSTLRASFATDQGGLYPSNTGLMLSLRKEWL